MICANCNAEFSRRVLIDGKIRDFKKRKYCLECSPLDAHNTSKISAPQLDPKVLNQPEIDEVNDNAPVGLHYEGYSSVPDFLSMPTKKCSCPCDCDSIDKTNKKQCEDCRKYFAEKTVKDGKCLKCYYDSCKDYVQYSIYEAMGGECEECGYDKYFQNINAYDKISKSIIKPEEYNTFDVGRMISKIKYIYTLLCNNCIYEHAYDGIPSGIHNL